MDRHIVELRGTGRMNRGRRLRAPRTDGGVLIDPPWPVLLANVAQVEARRGTRETAAPQAAYDMVGKSLAQLSREARAELLQQAIEYTQTYRHVGDAAASASSTKPLLLSGHQPELFHAGVWAKTFALSALAKQTGATAVNLVIDGDTLKSPSIRVPTGPTDEPRVEVAAFDDACAEMPYEERRILNHATFESFGRRAADLVRASVGPPLFDRFWPMVLEESKTCNLVGLSIARARHRLEGEWGLDTLELPQSRLCELPSFHSFVAHLLANLPRFHETHNGALADYRRVERIRGAGRPVPPLAAQDDWLEVPLWVWTAADPRRRRVFVRRAGDETLLSDRESLEIRLPAGGTNSTESTAAALGALNERGIRLRSRALLTTMFARVVVDCVFIHGIGGGKYDELTDEIARRFLGIEPPPFAVVTATRRLPMASPTQEPTDEAVLRERLWQLLHHPERFVDHATLDAEAAERAGRLQAEKQRLLAASPPRDGAREWCQAIRQINLSLQPFATASREKAERKLQQIVREGAAEAVRVSREYSSFLFPEKDLRDFLLAFPPD